jgi:hypothetical protein
MELYIHSLNTPSWRSAQLKHMDRQCLKDGHWEAEGVQMFRKFSAYYGTQRLVIMFTRTRHWFLFWERWIHSIPSYSVPSGLILISSHLHLRLTSGLSGLSVIQFIRACVLHVSPTSSSLIWQWRWYFKIGSYKQELKMGEMKWLSRVAVVSWEMLLSLR